MRFSCESCSAHYVISDEKVGLNGVKVRCKKCGNVIRVRRAVAAQVAANAPGPWDAGVGSLGADGDLDRELGQAFDHVFGGHSGADAASGGSLAAVATAGEVPAPSLAAPPPAVEDAPRVEAAPAAESTSDWYVAIDDEQVGPLAAPGVRARWEAGEIGPETLAWRPGLADWAPLSAIQEMRSYLAPFSRARAAAAQAPATTPIPTAAPAGAAAVALSAPSSQTVNEVRNGATHANGTTNGVQAAWQPSAATALAALASEELSSLEKPPADVAGASAEARPGSLVDKLDLPDGGVDPTNLLPLPMKALDQTSEAALPPRAPAPEATEIRQIKKTARRSGLVFGIAGAAVVVIVFGALAWFLLPATEAPPVRRSVSPPAVAAPAAVPAPAPSPAGAPDPAAATAAVPAPATTAPVPAASPAPAPPAATAAATPPAEASLPAAAAAEPAPPAASPAPKTAATAAADHPAVAAPAKREAPPARKEVTHRRELAASRGKGGAQRVLEPIAQRAEPTAAPAPAAPAPAAAAAPRRSGDPLLDVGDDELEKELGGKSKRSVFVPPAIGSDLPESVSVSQINEAVVGQKAALLRCIEQQKAADPSARGTLKVRWVIQGDGTPRDVKVLSDEFASQPIAACIGSVVKGVRFPRSRTSGQEVVFPFKF